MGFNLCPAVTLMTGSFSVVVAPVGTVTAALNGNMEIGISIGPFRFAIASFAGTKKFTGRPRRQ